MMIFGAAIPTLDVSANVACANHQLVLPYPRSNYTLGVSSINFVSSCISLLGLLKEVFEILVSAAVLIPFSLEYAASAPDTCISFPPPPDDLPPE
jgi:hypothetical protein